MQNKISNIKNKLTTDFLRKKSQMIINFYKKKNYSRLRRINKELFPGREDFPNTEKRLFYTLIKIFHPDSIRTHFQELDNAIQKCDSDTIDFYSRLVNMEITNRINIDLASAFQPDEEYVYEKAEYKSHIFTDEEADESEDDPDIMTIISRMFLGNTGITLEAVDLYQINGELNLSHSGLSYLEGLQYCKNITNLDLSHNEIDNIFEISSLEHLIELDLSNNHITDIDHLSDLSNLETLYLDNNQIENIDLLLELDELQFVSLTGNPLTSMETIYKLQKNDVIVIYY